MECKNNDVKAHGCRTSSGSLPEEVRHPCALRHKLLFFIFSFFQPLSIICRRVAHYNREFCTHVGSRSVAVDPVAIVLNGEGVRVS